MAENDLIIKYFFKFALLVIIIFFLFQDVQLT